MLSISKVTDIFYLWYELVSGFELFYLHEALMERSEVKIYCKC